MRKLLVLLVVAGAARAQTAVMAPGSQVPGAPLPRYVYNTVHADYAAPGGHPLTKSKFNLYDTIGPSRQQFDRLIDMMGELNVDSYRLELGWGRSRQGHGMHTAVGGTPEALTYDFEPSEHIVRELAHQGVLFLGAYSYTPHPLQDPNLSRRYGENNARSKDSTPPQDLDKWKEVITAFVTHHRDVGLPFGVHEVWNEPDGTYFFFSGTRDEYFQLYQATVEAVRAVDPDAVVGGPAADHHLLWNESFPEFVAANNLPLDALTFHHYSSATLAQRDMDMVCRSLNRFDEMDTTTLSMTEWNTSDWSTRVPEACARATQLLHDFQLFLTRPELSSVSWTTWVGLFTRDGHRRADFNAWKLYAMMPVDRRPVTIEGPLEAMASSDDHRAALLVWNNSAFQRRLDLHLDNVPFARGTVRLYRIDRENASYDDGAGEEVVPTETFEDIDTSGFAWQDGYIPPYGIIYLEAEDGTGQSELTPAEVAKVVRINRYYPNRGETSSYADFDRKTWIARLGMMDNPAANEKIGVLAEGLPAVLDVTVKVEGRLQRARPDSLLGVRVDYRIDGKYANPAFFHGPYEGMDLYDIANTRAAILPWALDQAPATSPTSPRVLDLIAVDDLSHFQINLKDRAPDGWTGTAHITFIMNATGPGTHAKFTVRPGDYPNSSE